MFYTYELHSIYNYHLGILLKWTVLKFSLPYVSYVELVRTYFFLCYSNKNLGPRLSFVSRLSYLFLQLSTLP